MSETAEEPQDSDETEVEMVDPIAVIQNAIASAVDDGSLLAGFVVVAEWFETDGRPTLSVIHSAMTPWHFDGLMKYATEFESAGQMVPMFDLAGDEDDEDDE